MGITLANFQLKAIEALMEAMGEPNRDIILKSCTGSGKTIILTHFMDEYLKSTNKAVFVWLTPGKGNLELQSKAKMDKYIHGSNTKLLSDIMSSGFEEMMPVSSTGKSLLRKETMHLRIVSEQTLSNIFRMQLTTV